MLEWNVISFLSMPINWLRHFQIEQAWKELNINQANTTKFLDIYKYIEQYNLVTFTAIINSIQ